MQLSLRTFSQSVAAMAAAVQGAATNVVNLTVGSTLRALLEAVAGQASWLQWLAMLALATSRFATSTGADCDTFGAQFSFTRLPAVAASGSVTFARYTPTNAAQIPVGSTVKTNDGTQSFVVVVDTTNAAYVADATGLTQGYYAVAAGAASLAVLVNAVVAGSGGNVLAGTIGLISSAITGIDTVTNAAAFTNGVNAESDAAYQARFQNYLPSLAKGTPIAVQAAVVNVAQNLTCSVIENVVAIGGAYAPGNFVVAVDDGSGATPSTTLAAVSTAVAAVRAITTNAYVFQATVISANVSMTLVTAPGANHSNAVAAVASAVAAYIGALPVGAALNYTKLAALAYNASSSITDVTGLTLNTGTADIGGTPGYVVRAGTIAVS